MNIHPIFVHFPIALLVLYSIFECARFRWATDKAYVFYVKAILVISGTLGGFLGLFTGDLAEESYRHKIEFKPLIEVHSTWAAAAVVVYCIISTAYLLAWFEQSIWFQNHKSHHFIISIWPTISGIIKFILKPWVVVLLAIIGLIAVSITGALGGAIVYGPDIDPIVNFTYHLFF